MVSQKVGLLTRHQARGASILGVVNPDHISISVPHAAYSCALQDVADGYLLEKAEQTAWRYLLFEGETVFAAAEVDQSTETKELSFSNFSTGTHVTNTISALRMAERLPQASSGDYEVRFLRIPSLYVAAIWLKGTDNILISLSTTHGLQLLERYTEEEFLKLLQEHARTILGFDLTTSEI
jgi:hypothetical protein